MMASARQPLQREHDNRPSWMVSKARARRVSYAVSIVVNAILLVFIQGLPNWWFRFITAAFIDVRRALEPSLGATIVANALFLAYDAAWFRELIQIALSALALLVIVVFCRRFPFDFGGTAMNDLGHLLLGLPIFALVVAILAQTIAWIVGLSRRALAADRADAATVGGQQRSVD